MQKIFSTLLLTLLLLTQTSIVFAGNPTKTDDTEPTPREQRELDFQERINRLFPSQESLFDRNRRADINQDGVITEEERIRLAEGDLEQDLAPRVIGILIGFSALAIMIFFVIAGLRLLLSRGDEEALTKTKQLMVQVIIGTVLIVGSFGIIVSVIRLFNAL